MISICMYIYAEMSTMNHIDLKYALLYEDNTAQNINLMANEGITS